MRNERSIDLDPVADEPAEVVAPADASADRLSQYVRTIYIGCYREFTGKMDYGHEPMPSWDGGETAFGRNCRPIWPRIAERILAIGADPANFIRAQFWSRYGNTRPPSPTYLLSSEAEARYGVYLRQAPAYARRAHDADLRSIQTEILLLVSELGWDNRRAVRYALLNRLPVQASALSRYCLAVSENLPEVAVHFHDQALLQYVFQQDVIDVAWGAHIPPSLREESVRLRAQILGGP
jgi:hypothetical protein